MQKPHVLQWLALGGLQMLHVEQYLAAQACLNREVTKGKQHIYGQAGLNPASTSAYSARGKGKTEGKLTSPNVPLAFASSIALHQNTTSARPCARCQACKHDRVCKRSHADRWCPSPVNGMERIGCTHPASPSGSALYLPCLMLDHPELLRGDLHTRKASESLP